jgi:transcriptional regulator with XRE-family HTH domain
MSLSVRLPLADLRVCDQPTTRPDPGACLRMLRTEKGIRPADIEHKSRMVAESKGDQEFFISHSALAGMENGSIPGIHKIFSLAVCLDASVESILRVFGVNAPEVDNFRQARDNENGKSGPILIKHHRLPQPDENCFFNDTSLLVRDLKTLPSRQAIHFKRPNPEQYRYAVIGSNDGAMREIIPAGSLVEVDPRQTMIAGSQWDTLQNRPVYLLWHEDGYSCGWCQMEDKKLLLLPHPAAWQYKVRIFRMPREVTIIGRVTYIWPPAACGALEPGTLAPLLTGTAG